jgi:adenylyltransferase/sulfurtransferase
MSVSINELARYSRHLLLPNFRKECQLKLCNSKVLIVGVGGLGSPVAQYLTAAGVGKIGLVDFDVVDVSNLQRQVIHRTSTIGKKKVESAKSILEDLNPYVSISTYDVKFSEENAESLINDYDVVVDCLDNFPGKFLINDACFFLKKPCVHAGALQFRGQVTTFSNSSTNLPCFRCILPRTPPRDLVSTCSRAGVLGSVVGVIGCVQSLEVIKLITGYGETLIGRLFMFNGETSTSKIVNFKKNEKCELCGDDPKIDEIEEETQKACSIDLPMGESLK